MQMSSSMGTLPIIVWCFRIGEYEWCQFVFIGNDLKTTLTDVSFDDRVKLGRVQIMSRFPIHKLKLRDRVVQSQKSFFSIEILIVDNPGQMLKFRSWEKCCHVTITHRI